MFPRASSSTQFVPVAGSSSSMSAASQEASNLEVVELKRKVDMLTEELSLNRMQLAKKSRRSSTSSRGQAVTIEIPDFPLEYYRVAGHAWSYAPEASLREWFNNFDSIPVIQGQPQAYHDWIQRRTLELLPKVLAVVGNNLKGSGRITGKDLLSCRLVNHSWKQSIDQFLQDSVPLDLPVFHQDKKTNIASCIRSDEDYQSVVDMLSALERNKHFRTLTPFPSGHLIIQYHSGMENRYMVAFNNMISTLLEFYGGTLQSFSYQDYRSQPDLTLVTSWLKKMRNLKSLQIVSRGRGSPIGQECHLPGKFPHLPKLITFAGIDVPLKLTDLMLTANPQIQNLSFNSLQPKWSKFKQLQLTSLSIKVTSVAQLRSLATLDLPLQKLRILGESDFDGVDSEELFQMLGSYEGTLRKLDLDLKVKENGSNWSLRLPCLQNLSIRLESAFQKKKSYDFLLRLEALEYLKIHLVSGEGTERRTDVFQVIQLYGYFERMYDSNLWNLLPRLKRVEVKNVPAGEEDSCRNFTYTRNKLQARLNGDNW